MFQSLTIAIIDDSVLYADYLKRLVETKMPWESHVHTFYNLKDFEKSIKSEVFYNFVLLDIHISNQNGLVFLDNNKSLFKKGEKIIMLSSLGNSLTIKQALQIGAKGFLSKNCSVEEFIEAFETIGKGQIYISTSFQKELAQESAGKQLIPKLTPREGEVLSYLCASYTAKEVAGKLHLSTNTVQMYVKSLFVKFKLNRTTDLVLYATKNKLNLPVKKR